MEINGTSKQGGRPVFSLIIEKIKIYWFEYVYLIVIAGAVVALDQWTKSLVRANIPMGADWLPDSLSWLAPYARIRHWHNTGTIFGLFQDASMVFTVLAFVVIALILYFYPQTPRKEWWLRVVLSIQLGGAIGNLVDRLVFHQVTDFLSVGNFAIFNIADMSISCGAAVLALMILLEARAEKKKAANTKVEVPIE
jgi:signal peptidase II